MLVDESMVASLNLDDAEGSSIATKILMIRLTNGAAMADGSIKGRIAASRWQQIWLQ